MPKVLVIVLNWRNWKDTKQCLSSLLTAKGVQISLALLDNGSGDESVAALDRVVENLQSSGLRVCFFKSNENLGFAQGINYVIEQTWDEKPDYYFLLNNDAQVLPETLGRLVHFSQEHDAPFVCSLSLNAQTGRSYFWGARHPWHLFGDRRSYPKDVAKRAWPTDFCEGAGLLLRADIVKMAWDERGGLLNKDFFMYCEDSDLGFYLGSHGIRGWIVEEANIVHKVSASTGGNHNPRVMYYITRNRIFLVKKWFSFPMKILFHLYYIPSRLLLTARRLLTGDWLAVEAALVGLWDGYRGKGGKWSKHT